MHSSFPFSPSFKGSKCNNAERFCLQTSEPIAWAESPAPLLMSCVTLSQLHHVSVFREGWYLDGAL